MNTLFILIDYSCYDSDGGSKELFWRAIDTKKNDLILCQPVVYRDKNQQLVISQRKNLYVLDEKFESNGYPFNTSPL